MDSFLARFICIILEILKGNLNFNDYLDTFKGKSEYAVASWMTLYHLFLNHGFIAYPQSKKG